MELYLYWYNVSREPRALARQLHDLVLLSLILVSVNGSIFQPTHQAQSVDNQAILLHFAVNFLNLPV